MLTPCPITIAAANAMVGKIHRHHKESQGHKFSIGCREEETGRLVGSVIVSMPRARGIRGGLTCEAARVTTDGTPDACSTLYGAAARAAEAMGFTKIITYIRVDEPGISLKAAGWRKDGYVKGEHWDRPSRRRQDATEVIDRIRWAKDLEPRRRRKR